MRASEAQPDLRTQVAATIRSAAAAAGLASLVRGQCLSGRLLGEQFGRSPRGWRMVIAGEPRGAVACVALVVGIGAAAAVVAAWPSAMGEALFAGWPPGAFWLSIELLVQLRAAPGWRSGDGARGR